MKLGTIITVSLLVFSHDAWALPRSPTHIFICECSCVVKVTPEPGGVVGWQDQSFVEPGAGCGSIEGKNCSINGHGGKLESCTQDTAPNPVTTSLFGEIRSPEGLLNILGDEEERVEKEKMELERMANERKEKERKIKERMEKERKDKEREDKERVDKR